MMRSLLPRVVARLLIVALVAALLPADAHASRSRSPTGTDVYPLPNLASQPLASAKGPLVYVVVVVADPFSLTKEAFGTLLAHTGTDPQPYAFTAEPLDPNSGWQYHRARWMDPGVGRFASADPFKGFHSDPVSLHRYTYAKADPLDAWDPTGRMSVAQGLATAALVTVVASITFSLANILFSPAMPIIVDGEALIVENSGWDESSALSSLRGAINVWMDQAKILVSVGRVQWIPDDDALRFVNNKYQFVEAANKALPYMTVRRGIVTVFIRSNGLLQAGIASTGQGKGVAFFSGNLPWPKGLLLAHEWGHCFSLPDQGVGSPPFSLEPLVLFGNLMTTTPLPSLTPGQRAKARTYARYY